MGVGGFGVDGRMGGSNRIESHRSTEATRQGRHTHTHSVTHPFTTPSPKKTQHTQKKGTDGVAGRDEERAIEYYTRAGAAGHGGALTTLGALFHQRGRYAEVCVGWVELGWCVTLT